LFCRDVCGHEKIIFISNQDILQGEELTLDYGPTFEKGIECYCGCNNCTGWISAPKVKLFF
jgi:SET domain-containing protein